MKSRRSFSVAMAIFILIFSVVIYACGDAGDAGDAGDSDGNGDGSNDSDNGDNGDGNNDIVIVDDHGDVLLNATFVSQSSRTPGNLERGGDIDVFRIDLSADGILTVETTGTTDTIATLLDSAGKFLAKDDDNGIVPNFKISLAVSRGTYLVMVEGFSRTTIGSYIFVSSFIPK